jgi:hypothetical protein
VARGLGDVLHYFLPEAEQGAARAPDDGPPARLDAAALPIVALPVAERDVVRAALAWNLTVEIARLGASASLLAPRNGDGGLLWPEPGRGPVGAELVLSPALDLDALYRDAADVAVRRAAEPGEGGVVLACVPPHWLRSRGENASLLRWALLFATPDARDLLETYALAKFLLRRRPDAVVGVTIHGVRRIAEAERAFQRLAGVAARHLGRAPRSYGLLVDDLHVYRAIVARRPIGLEHPQAPAAKALRDVARLVMADAQIQHRV